MQSNVVDLLVVLLNYCCNAADGHVYHEVKSTDMVAPSVSKLDVDAIQSDIRKSRKSLSLDDLQTVGRGGLMADPGDDPGLQSQSVMYARNMNQSFRVAVDKSFDVSSHPSG